MGLHETILNSRRGDYEGHKESSDFPEGITPEKLSELSKSFGNQAKFLFISATRVPESATARRMVDSSISLSSRYVVYSGFRSGCGTDRSYG